MTAQQRLCQGKVFWVGDLEIARAASHQQRLPAHGLHGARFIGDLPNHGLQRLQQHADAKHLGRLCEPFVMARQRSGNAALLLGLQGVSQGLCQQPTHRIAQAGIDQGVDLPRRHQAAGGIVNQHPILLGSALLA